MNSATSAPLGQCLKQGLIGGLAGAVMSAIVTYALIGMPSSEIVNAANNGIAGLVSGFLGGFLGVFAYAKSQRHNQ
jgi:hypothetical protein